MKAIGINGSPRKKWNTAILLGNVLKGVGAQGVKTELLHLYDYNSNLGKPLVLPVRLEKV
jgi:multimeric flavodoxin WrbA